MSKLVCMLGVIGSGKDYRTSQLVEQGYVQINFADPLRALTWKILGFIPENYEEFKKGFINYQKPDEYPEEAMEGLTGRELLQNIGSAMREISHNFWADKWFDSVYPLLCQNKNIVCSDLRHINELKTALDIEQETIFLKNNEHCLCEVEFVFCDYRSDRYEPDNSHSSEHLAQRILKDGYKDGDILSVEYLKELVREGII